MGNLSRKIDVHKLISYSDDLMAVLKDERDKKTLAQCLKQSQSLQSFLYADFNETQTSIEDYQKKINAYKQKSEVAADSDFDLLQKELKELQKEHELMEELRVTIICEVNDLEHQRISFEERKQNLKKLDQDELRRKLSMYASVTNTIPNLNDDSKISGHIVDRDKSVVEKFEFDQEKISASDTCQTIWKVINLQ